MSIDWNFYDTIFEPLVKANVRRLNNGNPVYYEAYIDLNDRVNDGKWVDYITNYPYLAAFSLAKFVIKRAKTY